MSLEAQAALYRSLLAGRRVLVVLDNAADEDQVRPLLPGAPGCLVIVTSRNALPGLIVTEGAHQVDLDLLSAAEARQLLSRRIGESRVVAETAAADDIIDAVRPAAPGPDAGGRRGPLPTPGSACPRWRPSCARRAAPWMRSAARIRPPTCGPSSRGPTCASAPLAAACSACSGCIPARTSSTAAVVSLAGVAREQVRPVLAELARAHLVTERRSGPVRLPRPAPRVRHRAGPAARSCGRPAGGEAPDARSLPAQRLPGR